MNASKLRTCSIGKNNEPALFHMWGQFSEIVPPSNMIGGHAGGVVSGVLAIVETEDGRVLEVRPDQVVFTDSLAKSVFESAKGRT